MDIFEYDEVRWPTRALQQEEEEQAVPTAEAALQPPHFQWLQEAQQITQPQLLVVAMSPASSALFEAALSGKQAIATIHSPAAAAAARPQPDADLPSSPRGSTSAGPTAQLYAADNSNTVVVCCCSGTVAAEAAPAWARGVLQQLQPQRLLLVGTMQADQYRGDADPSQEFTAFLLHTSVAAAATTTATGPAAKPSVPFLPSGSLVAGLPAALITQAELEGMAAQLVAVVETVAALVPETLQDLAQVVAGLLGSEAEGGLVGQVQQTRVIEQARTKLQQTTCRPTSVYS